MLQGKSVVAVIPARANSSGCPGKNYRIINGKPLICWSIDAAMQSQYIDTIVVSTNDENVAAIVREYPFYGERVFIVNRPDHLATPTAKTEWAMIHALSEIKKQYGIIFDITVLLQPTSPVRRDKLIDRCLNKMSKGFDSAITVTEKTPFFWQMKAMPRGIIGVGIKEVPFGEGGATRQEFSQQEEPQRFRAEPNYSIYDRPMRQNLPEFSMQWHDNGNVYCCRSDVLFMLGQRTGYNPALIITPFFESLQIDTEEDFRIIEKLYELYGSFI